MENENDKDFIEQNKIIDDLLKNKEECLNELKKDINSLSNSNKIKDSIANIIWKQFIIQIGGTAGQDFINKNNNLNLSLKDSDHILNEVNFINQKFPTHNTAHLDEYKNRYVKWSSKFLDANQERLNKNYRNPYDRNRPTGNENYTMDHVIPVKEIIRDKTAATFMDQSEKVKFANDTSINLKPLPGAANASKSDKTMTDWIDSLENNNSSINEFNLDEKDLRKLDDEARKEWEDVKETAKEKAIYEGNISIREEALKSLGITTQAILIALLAKLTRDISSVAFTYLYDKSKDKKEMFKEIKQKMIEFIFDLKGNIALSLDVGITSLLYQIYGPIVASIRAVLLLGQVGIKNTIEIIKYLQNPENKSKDQIVKTIEVGQILTVGFSTFGGIALGRAITKGIEKIIPVTIKIYLLGPLSSLLGIFFGGLISGMSGAFVMRYLNDILNDREKSKRFLTQIKQQNEIIALQYNKSDLYVDEINKQSKEVFNEIKKNIKHTTEQMDVIKDSTNKKRESLNKEKLDDIELMINSIKERS